MNTTLEHQVNPASTPTSTPNTNATIPTVAKPSTGADVSEKPTVSQANTPSQNSGENNPREFSPDGPSHTEIPSAPEIPFNTTREAKSTVELNSSVP